MSYLNKHCNNLRIENAYITRNCNIDGKLKINTITVDTITERSLSSGVTIEGVLMVDEITSCNNLECDTINQNKFGEIDCQICENKSTGFGWTDKRFSENDENELGRFLCLNCIFDDLLEKKAKMMWNADLAKK